MAGTFTVRPAGRDDLPALLGLLVQLDPRTPQAATAAERAAEVWAEIESQASRAVLVAQMGDGVVGTADLVVVANLTHGGAPWAIVENVVVDERARRRGVARGLMQEVLARARAAGCYKVQLLSRSDRREAQELYRSLGFERSADGFRLYF